MATKPIHLVVPMSGQGTRYRKAGYQQPKPLIPVSGVPMINRLMAVFPHHWPATFVLAENHRDQGLAENLAKIRPEATLRWIPPHTLGPSHAIEVALKGLSDDTPVLISYCDYGMVWDPIQFERFVETSECDACLISYRGFHAHYLSPTKYAYSRMDGERVVEVREKGSFTDNRENEYASAGGYYFRSAKILKEAIAAQKEMGLALNGEYYTSLTVEALLRSRSEAHVRVFEIPGFFQWGTPEDLRTFEYWEKSFQSHNRFLAAEKKVDQVLMPMAGFGSRFTSVTPTLKPLIPVQGTPMFKAALQTLPKAGKAVFVSLKRVESEISPHLGALETLVSLAETPAGQALSTEAGLGSLDSRKEVLVSSCDHGIVLNPEIWSRFRKNPDCDAAIFTVCGYPGADRRPTAYAYVEAENPSEDFPSVKSVSVKKPLSDSPSLDPLLVGTFWFRTAEVLAKGISDLKTENVRVNGELYLDSVFQILMKKGLRVRMIPLDGYLCWGDPDSLAESLYWAEIFGGRRTEARKKFPGV